MRIKKGFKIRKIDDLFVVLPTAQASKEFHGMITLNESGALIWDHLQKDVSEEALAEALIAEYGIDREVALADVRTFLEKIRERNLLDG